MERIHRTLKAALFAQGGVAVWKDHLPWVLLGMRAAPREESGVLGAEGALQQQLVVPGQLPPPSKQPAGMEELPVPLGVIPPIGCSYAQAATSSPLDGADWVYVVRGGASKPMADKYSSSHKVLERGNKAWKLQVGEMVDIVSIGPHETQPGQRGPQGRCAPTRGRPRTASIASVASPSLAEKPGEPV